MSFRLRLTIGSLLLLLAISLGIYMYIIDPESKRADKHDAHFQLDAIELYGAFISDPKAAESMFKGKTVVITGEVTFVEHSGNSAVVVFEFSSGLFGNEGVQCFLNEKYIERALDLWVGEKITVKGAFSQFTGTDVVLLNCSILE